MVGVLVRMKLRVLRNTLRGRRIVAVVVGGLVGLVAALFTAAAGLVPFGSPESTVDVLAAVFALWFVGWVLAPIATGGGDETLRPEYFTLLPIGRRRLAVGLLAASFVGVTTLVTLVAFTGLLWYGLRLGPGAALVGVVFMVLQLLLVVLVYRVVMAALGALLTSRKGRDLGILLVALTGLSGVGVNYAVHSIGPALAQGRTPALAVVVKALPSGWGTVAVRAAGDGRWIRVVLLGAGMVVLLGLLTLAWAALLARRATSAQFRGAARVRASDGGIRRWSPLPRSPVGAVAGKELRTWWRDARRRVALLSALLTGLIMAVGPGLATGGGHQATLPFIGLWVVFFSCAQTGNLYGLDGSALWHTLVVPGAERADVRGRQLAWALIVGPLGLLCCLVLPGAVGRPQTYPWVLSLFLATFGAGAGALVLQAAFVPFPLPDQRTRSSPFSSGGRPGCTRAVQLLGILLLLVVAAVPVVVLEVVGVVARLPALQWAGLPLGLATGALLAWWWGRLAQDRLVLRGPEILATVSKEA